MVSSEKRSRSREMQRYLVRFEDEGEMRLAFTQNVSSEGVFLKTRFPPPPGAGVRMLIRTSTGAEARSGVVMWARLNLCSPHDPRKASGAGIQFKTRAAEVIADS